MTITLGILLLCALAALAAVAVQLVGAQRRAREATAQHASLQQYVGGLQAEVASLAKYRAITNVEATAAQIHAHAQTTAARIQGEAQSAAQRTAQEAQQVLARAVADAQRTMEDAYRRAQEAESAASVIQARATRDAQDIVARATANGARAAEEAHKRAEHNIAAAVRAAEETKALERAAEALKNVIDGYGDAYVIPTAGLLDELADEFGFTEAGQRLKSARTTTRELIKAERAADCDYVEANRRTTAIAFVLDAFNGKVDTILADVRHDNGGTLKQKIVDAFALVNLNGAAFRDARITREYLDARLEELRWAVVANELKLREREEQRVLKERLREEERAQKEFEKALKEAEKEEEVLQKAMEKARRELEKASDEQKAKYEAKLLELGEKLREAEERGKRALSMAQQTKAGHVYVISNVGSFGEHVYKIGMTRRLEPLDRVRELGDASVPFEFDVHALIPTEDAPALENAIHRLFAKNQVNKVNPRKEFFRTRLEDIRTEAEKMGVAVGWTMTAMCREYRETVAMERAGSAVPPVAARLPSVAPHALTVVEA